VPKEERRRWLSSAIAEEADCSDTPEEAKAKCLDRHAPDEAKEEAECLDPSPEEEEEEEEKCVHHSPEEGEEEMEASSSEA
jgi:hypothetical protein